MENLNTTTIIIISFCAGSIVTSFIYRWQMKKIIKKQFDKYFNDGKK